MIRMKSLFKKKTKTNLKSMHYYFIKKKKQNVQILLHISKPNFQPVSFWISIPYALQFPSQNEI